MITQTITHAGPSSKTRTNQFVNSQCFGATARPSHLIDSCPRCMSVVKRLLEFSVPGRDVVYRDSPDSIALVQTLAYFKRLQGLGQIEDDACIAFRVPGAYRRIRARLLSREKKAIPTIPVEDAASQADYSQDELFASTLADIGAEQIVSEIRKVLGHEPECRVMAFILDCLAIPLDAVSRRLNDQLGVYVAPVTLRQWRKRYFHRYCELVRSQCGTLLDPVGVA